MLLHLKVDNELHLFHTLHPCIGYFIKTNKKETNKISNKFISINVANIFYIPNVLISFIIKVEFICLMPYFVINRTSILRAERAVKRVYCVCVYAACVGSPE